MELDKRLQRNRDDDEHSIVIFDDVGSNFVSRNRLKRSSFSWFRTEGIYLPAQYLSFKSFVTCLLDSDLTCRTSPHFAQKT
jgi:hypothetical protein